MRFIIMALALMAMFSTASDTPFDCSAQDCVPTFMDNDGCTAMFNGGIDETTTGADFGVSEECYSNCGGAAGEACLENLVGDCSTMTCEEDCFAVEDNGSCSCVCAVAGDNFFANEDDWSMDWSDWSMDWSEGDWSFDWSDDDWSDDWSEDEHGDPDCDENSPPTVTGATVICTGAEYDNDECTVDADSDYDCDVTVTCSGSDGDYEVSGTCTQNPQCDVNSPPSVTGATVICTGAEYDNDECAVDADYDYDCDVTVTCSGSDGDYEVSGTCTEITDCQVYDASGSCVHHGAACVEGNCVKDDLTTVVTVTLDMPLDAFFENLAAIISGMAQTLNVPEESIHVTNVQLLTRRRRLRGVSADFLVDNEDEAAKAAVETIVESDSFADDLTSEIHQAADPKNGDLQSATVTDVDVVPVTPTCPASDTDSLEGNVTGAECMCSGTSCAVEVGSFCTVAGQCVAAEVEDDCGACSATCGDASRTCAKLCKVGDLEVEFEGNCDGSDAPTVEDCDLESCGDGIDAGAMEITMFLAVFLVGLLF